MQRGVGYIFALFTSEINLNIGLQIHYHSVQVE